MANTLKIKRGTAATIPQGQLAEPLFTTDTYDLYIGKGSGGNQRFQKYIASGTSSQFLKGDGTLDSTTYQATSEKGQNNGYASLDSGGKVPIAQLPNSIIEYKGTWNASTNTPTLADGTGNTGDVYIVSVGGTQNLGSGSITFAAGDWVMYNGTIWEKSINSNAVASVNGQTGVVSIGVNDLDDATITSASNGQLLQYSTGTNKWVNWTPTYISAAITSLNGLTGASQTFATGTTGTDFGISSSGSIHTFNLPIASATNTGKLSSTDWSTFNGKVSTSRTLTINGTAQDLSADRTWSVGTVTSVAALTIGTTGTDITSTVANGTTTPVITLNIPTASATNRGALSSADWTTFNNKQNAITLTTTGSSGAATFVSSTLNIPNYTLSGLGGVPTSRTLTINGTGYDLSADRTWSVGTVTSIALATGTSGTDVNVSGSPVTGSGTITLNIPDASATARGLITTGTQTIAGLKTFTSNVHVGGGSAAEYAFNVGEGRTGNGNAYIDLIGDVTYSDYGLRMIRGNTGANANSSILHRGTGSLILETSDGSTIRFRNTAGTDAATISGGNLTLSNGGDLVITAATSGSNTTLYNDTGTLVITTPISGTSATFSGDVGVGTNNPLTVANYKSLDIRGTTGGLIEMGNTSNQITGRFLELVATSTSAEIKSFNSVPLILGTNGTTRLTLDGSTGAATFNSSIAATSATFSGNLSVGSVSTNGIGIILRNGTGVSRTAYITQIGTNASSSDITWYSGVNVFATDGSFEIKNASGNGLLLTASTGAATFSDSINSGQGRFKAWYTSGTGNAVEIGVSSGNGNVLCYDRTLGQYNPLILSGGDASGNRSIAITSTGIGIGTGSPTGLLHLYGADPAFRIQSSTTGNMQFGQWDGTYNRIQSSGRDFLLISTDATNLLFSTNSSERMRITSGGNVGIGTNSPSSRLHVANSAGGLSAFIQSTATNGEAQIDLEGRNSSGTVRNATFKYDNSDIIRLGTSSNIAMRFETNDAERMRITNAGELLIGTTTDSGDYKLQVNGNIYAGGGGDLVLSPASSGGNVTLFNDNGFLQLNSLFRNSTNSVYSGATSQNEFNNDNSANYVTGFFHRNTNPNGIQIYYSAADPNGTGNPFLNCYAGGATKAEIRSNGGLANYQANNANLSDIRTKTDIISLDSYWNKFKQLDFVKFKYKDQTHDDYNIGLIAQQVEQIAPEFIDTDGWGKTPEDEVPLKTIYTTDLYHAAMAVLKEALIRIEKLENK